MSIKQVEAKKQSKRNNRKRISRLKKLGINILENGVKDVLMYIGIGIWIWLAGCEINNGERQMMALLMGGIFWGIGVTGNWWKIVKRFRYKTGMGMGTLVKGVMGAIATLCLTQYHTQNKGIMGPDLFLWIWVYVFMLWGLYKQGVMKRKWKYTTKKKRERMVEDLLVGLGIGMWIWVAGSEIKTKDWYIAILTLGGVMWGVGMSRNGWRLLRKGKEWICYKQKEMEMMKKQINKGEAWQWLLEGKVPQDSKIGSMKKDSGQKTSTEQSNLAKWVIRIFMVGLGMCFVRQIYEMVSIEPIKMTGTLTLYILMALMGKIFKKVAQLLVTITKIYGKKIFRNIKVSLGKMTLMPKKVLEKIKVLIKQKLPIIIIDTYGLILVGWVMAFLSVGCSIYFGTWKRQDKKILIKIWLAISVVGWGLWNLGNTKKKEEIKTIEEEMGTKKLAAFKTHTVITTRQRSVWIRVRRGSEFIWRPKRWEERKLSICPKKWLVEKSITNKHVNKEKFNTGGGKKLWNKVRQRAIGKEW